MDIEKIYADIQTLPYLAAKIRTRDSETIKFLQNLYLTVTGLTVYAGCKNCHIKAANYLSTLTIQNLIEMSEQKFKLKKGLSIEWPFRSGQKLISDNLTDAKAAEFLLNNPSGVQHFADYPTKDGKLDLSPWYPVDEPVADEPKSKKKKGKDDASTEEAEQEETVIEVPEEDIIKD